MVAEENRLPWLEYSLANTGWLTEGRQYQAEKGLGTMVGGDPYINKDIIFSDESGEIYLDPGVSTKPAKKYVSALIKTHIRSVFVWSAAGTLLSHLAVVPYHACPTRRGQLQHSEVTSVWTVCFSFVVHWTNRLWRNAYGSTWKYFIP